MHSVPRRRWLTPLPVVVGTLVVIMALLEAIARLPAESDDRTLGLYLPKTFPEMTVSDATLADLAAFTKDVAGGEVRLDLPRLAAAGVKPDTVFRARIKGGTPFPDALRNVFATLGVRVELVANRDGTFTITTPESCTHLRVYDVRPIFIDPIPTRGDRDGEELIEDVLTLVQETVDPDSWRAYGGNIGDIGYAGGRLFVVQTPHNHEQVAALIRTLEETAVYRHTLVFELSTGWHP